MNKTRPVVLVVFLCLAALFALTQCRTSSASTTEPVSSGYSPEEGPSDPQSEERGGVLRDLNTAETPAGEPSDDAVPQPISPSTTGTLAQSGTTEATTVPTATGTDALGVISDERETTTSSSGTPSARTTIPTGVERQESGLRAGFSDDNRQFNYFLNFLAEYSGVPHVEIPVSERIVLQIQDSNSRSIADAQVRILAGQISLCEGRTLADGRFPFYPREYADARGPYTAVVSYSGREVRQDFARDGERNVVVRFSQERRPYRNVPIDICFVLDTTGSMGEEIERLRVTIQQIYLNLAVMSIEPQVRFGMVLYRDVDDEYRTQVVPFTSDMGVFQAALDRAEADGGGDTPEDLQAALSDAVNQLNWISEGVKLAFIITDAPPHLDYRQTYTYFSAARDARLRGIRVHSVGTGGLPTEGEYVLRQIAQYTGGRYIFLTYGEEGESQGGAPGSVSHHTGANYQTDRLETIILRFAREELAYLSDTPLPPEDDFFEARPVATETRDQTLNNLFLQAVDQLVDYSSLAIAPRTTALVMPIETAEGASASNAEYFTERLIMSLASSESLRMVDRSNLQTVLEELEFQYSNLADPQTTVRLGQFLGANLLIQGRLYRRQDSYELFLKLIRVETAEILAASRAVIALDLGL